MELGTTVYIAGKMRGVRYMNFIEFFRWHHVLETSGYVVLNPAASDVERFFRPWYRKALGFLWRVFIWRSWYEDVMRYDLNLIREKADWLFVLKTGRHPREQTGRLHWRGSWGCRCSLRIGR